MLLAHTETSETGGAQVYIGDKLLEEYLTVDTQVAGSQSMNFIVNRKAAPAAD